MSNGTAVAVAQRRDLMESLKHPKMQEQLRMSLPPSVSLERFTAVTISAISHNPDLADADRQSLYNAIVKAAQDGLLPNGVEAFLNVYSTNIAPRGTPPRYIQKVEYQKMVGGIIKLFEEAGIDAWAESIHENDFFDVWADESGQHFTHRPVRLGGAKGGRVGVYAAAKRPGSRSLIIQVMDMDDLRRVRQASRSPDKGPWAVWPERMEQKAALHRLKKRVATIDPKAAEILGSIDNEFDDDDDKAHVETSGAAQAPPPDPIPAHRPKNLQSLMDQEGTPSAEVSAPKDVDDPGPQPDDII